MITILSKIPTDLWGASAYIFSKYAPLFYFGAKNTLIIALSGTIIGLIIGFQCSQAYTTDAYEARYAASAASVGAFMRTMMGFSFPLFAPRMYETMGLGWGNSLLAFLTLVLALISPVLLWFYGPALRRMSTRGLR